MIGEGEELIGSLDPQTLDPAYSYRWVHESNQKLARRLSQGYRFVSRTDDKVAVLYDSEGLQGDDDKIRHGDTVLLKIPKAQHQKLQDRIDVSKRARLGAPKGQFRKKARSYGVEVDDKKE